MLQNIIKNSALSLYEIESIGSPDYKPLLKRYIASTQESRSIMNDPLILGLDYTNKLTKTSTNILKGLTEVLPPKLLSTFTEDQSVVLNILRGGLNFGIREALHKGLNWNQHSTAFISAQRARKSDDLESWHITETEYQKIFLPPEANVIFGDVVATGTSLEYALNSLVSSAKDNDQTISSFVFLTIGGVRSEEIIERINQEAIKLFPNFVGSSIVYLEGRFHVASLETPVQIKETGTDLLRRDSLLSKEFITSQVENCLYALERCTIYDAGSRAFWIPEYINDVIGYWQETKELCQSGLDYKNLIAERFPEILDPILNQRPDFLNIDLIKEIDNHLNLLKSKLPLT